MPADVTAQSKRRRLKLAKRAVTEALAVMAKNEATMRELIAGMGMQEPAPVVAPRVH